MKSSFRQLFYLAHLAVLFVFVPVAVFSQKELLCGFKKGLQEGTCRDFYEDGQVKAIVEWDKGKPEGSAEYFHPNGKQQAKGHHKKGFRTGRWEFFFDNGNPEAIEYYGIVDNTQILEGEVINYYRNGMVKSKIPHKENKRHGECIWYHENGNISSRFFYKNGDATGEAVFYRETAGVLDGRGPVNAKGLKEGSWQYYYEDGLTLETKGSYSNDLQQGHWQSFHKNGKVKSESWFISGKREGERKLYDENGKLIKTEIYKNGQLLN